jgi:tRNA uridine 5-carbamoylmethylation protein Kti12
MRQKLILITGSPCVGKTLIGEKLHKNFNNSAYLDGD